MDSEVVIPVFQYLHGSRANCLRPLLAGLLALYHGPSGNGLGGPAPRSLPGGRDFKPIPHPEPHNSIDLVTFKLSEPYLKLL